VYLPISDILAGHFISFMGVAATRSFSITAVRLFRFAARKIANIKTTNATYIANHEVRRKTGNSRTILNLRNISETPTPSGSQLSRIRGR
jgi:hypothetical protein